MNKILIFLTSLLICVNANAEWKYNLLKDVDDHFDYYIGTSDDIFVPYNGATANVDLGTFSLSAGTLGAGVITGTSLLANGTGGIRLGTAAGNAPYIFPFNATAYSIPVASGTSLAFYSYATTGSTYAIAFTGDTVISTTASGVFSNFVVPRGFAPSSGSCAFNVFHILSTINQTGGASGITRGLYVAPTLTSVANWRSIETANDFGYSFYGAGTAPAYFGGALTVVDTGQFGRIQLNANGSYGVQQGSNEYDWDFGVGAIACYTLHTPYIDNWLGAGAPVIFNNAITIADTGLGTVAYQVSGMGDVIDYGANFYIGGSFGGVKIFSSYGSGSIGILGNVGIGIPDGNPAIYPLEVIGPIVSEGASAFVGWQDRVSAELWGLWAGSSYTVMWDSAATRQWWHFGDYAIGIGNSGPGETTGIEIDAAGTTTTINGTANVTGAVKAYGRDAFRYSFMMGG